MSIKDFSYLMNANLTSMHINWLEIINSTLSFEVDENFMIFVEDAGLLTKIMELLDSLDSRTFANFLAFEIMIEFSNSVLIYFVTPSVENSWGVSKSFQRFEQCSRIIQENLPVGLTSLFVRRFAKLNVIEAAYEVGNRTVQIISSRIRDDESIPKQHRDYLVDKFKAMNLILGYPKELLEKEKIEKVYSNLNLTGDENLATMMFETFKFRKENKFKNLIPREKFSFEEDETLSWIAFTTEDEYWTPLYKFLEDNTICKSIHCW
jgi:Peptidase family M13